VYVQIFQGTLADDGRVVSVVCLFVLMGFRVYITKRDSASVQIACGRHSWHDRSTLKNSLSIERFERESCGRDMAIVSISFEAVTLRLLPLRLRGSPHEPFAQQGLRSGMIRITSSV
jgi:hypothetical protein